MGAKRLRRKGVDLVEKLASQLDPVLDEPLQLTCPDCGAKVEQTAHTCPHCGMLFHERERGKAPRLPANGPPKTDPTVTEFAQRMDHIERVTRILCVVGGFVFALLAGLSLWAMLSGFGGVRTGAAGLVLFGLLSLVLRAGAEGRGRRAGNPGQAPRLPYVPDEVARGEGGEGDAGARLSAQARHGAE
jgi:hypothetical protein